MKAESFRRWSGVNASWLPTDAAIAAGERARRQAAEIGSRMLLERIHDLLAKQGRAL